MDSPLNSMAKLAVIAKAVPEEYDDLFDKKSTELRFSIALKTKIAVLDPELALGQDPFEDILEKYPK